MSHTSTRLTNNYVKIFAKSFVLEEQHLKANFVNICGKDGLTNFWISWEKLMDQTSDWPERQKEDRASSAAVSSVVEK